MPMLQCVLSLAWRWVLKALVELSDRELIQETHELRGKEKAILSKLLLHFGEIDERKLYRNEGYPSLFTYLTEALGYSNASAYRRVTGARFLNEHPELLKDLESGELSFSALVELSKCEENVKEAVAESRGKSLAEVTQIVEERTAPPVKKRKREVVRRVRHQEAETPLGLFSARTHSRRTSGAEVPVGYNISFQADEEFMKLYREAKAVAGGSSMEEVFKKVLMDFTKRKSPKEREKRRQKRAAKRAESSNSRYIPVATRDKVYIKHEGRCCYVSPQGVRCSAKEHLEFDHVKPHALGGDSSEDNIRLLCRSHNQLMAERTFGKDFMASKRQQV